VARRTAYRTGTYYGGGAENARGAAVWAGTAIGVFAAAAAIRSFAGARAASAAGSRRAAVAARGVAAAAAIAGGRLAIERLEEETISTTTRAESGAFRSEGGFFLRREDPSLIEGETFGETESTGLNEAVVTILEGTKPAFENRYGKYH